MRLIGTAAACAMSISLLAACSGGDVSTPSATAIDPSSLNGALGDTIGPDACAKSKIYVADYLENDIEIYSQDATSKPCGRRLRWASARSEGIYIDAKSTLLCPRTTSDPIPLTEIPHARKIPSITITPAAPHTTSSSEPMNPLRCRTHLDRTPSMHPARPRQALRWLSTAAHTAWLPIE